MKTTNSPLRIAYVVRSFPRLSQTFILNEVLALEESGVQVRIFSSINPAEEVVQPQVKSLQAQVDYLQEAFTRSWWLLLWEHLLMIFVAPQRYLRTLWYVIRHPESDEGYKASTRYGCFLQAVYLAHLLWREKGGNGEIEHIHAHFAHDPTLIAHLASMLTGLTYSFTAHARDIYQIAPVALAERIKHALAVVTVCALNLDYFKSIVPAKYHAKLRVIHNGINLNEFKPAQRAGEGATPLIVSASRLVEKKGYLDLLAACRQLKERGYDFRCKIYGEGPLYATLEEHIQANRLGDCVTLAGVYTHQELQQIMSEAAIFALTPFVTDDGDRDGIPTALAEAMACGVPVVSTTVAGIPELVAHEHNGLLAAPHAVAEIAANLETLLTERDKRRNMGVAARQTIVEQFNLRTGAQMLARLYENAVHNNIPESSGSTI